ncbi:MAG: hypothetical protein KC933_36605 [Myxococcales bacterium]|nr:hypothetical protein [Myxococcales bacterium]
MTSDRRAALALGVAALLFTGRCGGYTSGIEVVVALRPQAPTLGFTTDLGHTVRLDQAVVRVSSLRLVPCAPSVAEALMAAASSVAFAHHVDTSPDQGEGAAPLDILHANGTPIPVTTLRPPPGRYCQVELVFGPPEDEPYAAAVRLEGAFETGAAFTYLSPAVAQVVLPIAPALELSAEHMQAELTILADQRRWLDGQEPSASAGLDPGALHQSIARSLRLQAN